MKKINAEDAYYVISEPGDMTRYTYCLIYADHHWCVVNNGNTFVYPAYIEDEEIESINNLEDCIDHINKYHIDDRFKGVNPNTLLEVVTTLKDERFYKWINELEDDRDNIELEIYQL